ncbi:MAG: hypothetical protein ABIO29_08760 [Sphingomicrobium sp.]
MSAAAPSLDAVLGDAQWLPLRLSEDATTIRFVHLPREDHQRLRYLEDKFLPAGTATADLPVALVAARPIAAAPPRFIFHSSMCGSTLLARVLDQPGHSMALAEPIILNQISARFSRGEDVGELLALAVALLSRPFGAGEQVVIKPGNSANNLMPQIAERFPQMRAVALEASVEDLLRAVAKRGPQGRIIYRRLYAFVARTRHLDTGFTPEDMWELTDLQAAALAWLVQHCEFADMLKQRPDQFRSLTMDALLGERGDAMTALGAFFEAAWAPAEVASDPRFNRHSKDSGRAYDDHQRRRDAEEVNRAFGPEIEWTGVWTRDLAEHLAIPLDLPNQLVR